jgi:nucleotide-binding universal stress UspA family protein
MRILYATDGSEGATAAARLLTELPLTPECTLTVLTVVEDDRHDDGDAVLDAAAETLGRCTASLERRTRRGHPAAEIIQAAEEHQTDLVVLGSHGRSAVARFFLGSVAERVARHASCPVLLVRGPGNGLRRVILGVDGSDGAGRAAEWLRQFPLPPGCEIRLVTVLANLDEITRHHMMVFPPFTEMSIPLDEWQREQASACLTETVAAFAAAGMPVVTEIRSGDPATGLLQVAGDEGADLVVVGSHGLGALERFMLDSVSENVLRHAHCSVLIVRAGASA